MPIRFTTNSYFYGKNGVEGFTIDHAQGGYFFGKNLQGDITEIYDAEFGQCVGKYVYDAWGNCTIVLDTNGVASANPFRYRGYYYDTETGLYYVKSRYYDPSICRWISPDISETLSGDFEDHAQYNLYAYCFNNPVVFTDETGEWPDWATKLVAVVAVAAVVVAATAVTVSTFGASSVAGVAAISGAITIAAKATEVASLQIDKSRKENKASSEVAIDVIESTFDNGIKILSPCLTKTVTTNISFAKYELLYNPVLNSDYIGFMKKKVSASGKKIPYLFAMWAWYQTLVSIAHEDPEKRAKERGYTLN